MQIELKEGIKQISARRRQWDDMYSQVQSLIRTKPSPTSTAQLRQQFTTKIELLRQAVRDSTQELDRLRYKAEKLSQEGQDASSSMRSIEALISYFQELGQKVKEQYQKGDQEISERERWEISQNDHEGFEEESQLIMSANGARDVREKAEVVLGSLNNQGTRLQAAREKMGSVLKGINLSGNIANLIKRRSREDNRLILWLTLGLLLEIYLCIFHIRPYLRGN